MPALGFAPGRAFYELERVVSGEFLGDLGDEGLE